MSQRDKFYRYYYCVLTLCAAPQRLIRSAKNVTGRKRIRPPFPNKCFVCRGEVAARFSAAIVWMLTRTRCSAYLIFDVIACDATKGLWLEGAYHVY
eukprot:6379230-Pyramimonas_sp.AAC.1